MIITAPLAGYLEGDVGDGTNNIIEDVTNNTVEELVEGCMNSTSNNYNLNATDAH